MTTQPCLVKQNANNYQICSGLSMNTQLVFPQVLFYSKCLLTSIRFTSEHMVNKQLCCCSQSHLLH